MTEIFTFLQGFGDTLKEAMNCFLCADVRMVRGRLGPRLPSRGRDPSSTMKSSPRGPVGDEDEGGEEVRRYGHARRLGR